MCPCLQRVPEWPIAGSHTQNWFLPAWERHLTAEGTCSASPGWPGRVCRQLHVSDLVSSLLIAKHVDGHFVFFTLAPHLRNWKIEAPNRRMMEAFAPLLILFLGDQTIGSQ